VSSPVGRPHRLQPLFGSIDEGVNLLHVVATTPGHPEPLVAGLIQGERGLQDPEERVANLLSERVDLRRLVARPLAG
jgi:hypothetical protein